MKPVESLGVTLGLILGLTLGQSRSRAMPCVRGEIGVAPSLPCLQSNMCSSRRPQTDETKGGETQKLLGVVSLMKSQTPSRESKGVATITRHATINL